MSQPNYKLPAGKGCEKYHPRLMAAEERLKPHVTSVMQPGNWRGRGRKTKSQLLQDAAADMARLNPGLKIALPDMDLARRMGWVK